MKVTAYVLLFGFLFQPFIVYWASPSFYTNTATGLTDVTCTLKGKAIQHSSAVPERVEKLSKDQYCSAVKLVDMANSTLHFAVPEYHSHTLYLIGLVDQSAVHQHPVLHYNSYFTRAPPRLS